MACLHGDDPAPIPLSKYKAPDLSFTGTTSTAASIASGSMVSNLIVGYTTLFGSGDKLLEMKDEQGTAILTVYRDGRVVNADPTKIDAAAKDFWMLMAKYMPQFCKQDQPR
jgi:hypothetical protein